MTTELLLALGIPAAYLLRLRARRAIAWNTMVGLSICPGGNAMGVEQAMGNPLWMLLPWAVFAIAAGIKFWRLTALFRKHLLGIPCRSERFRQRLERIWARSAQKR